MAAAERVAFTSESPSGWHPDESYFHGAFGMP
jgi:hypothetical protein